MICYLLLNDGKSQYKRYKRVKDKKNILKFKKFRQWIPRSVNISDEYCVLCNVDSEGYYTGIVKIVKKTKATVKKWVTICIEANPEDWIYYEKE